MPCRHRSDTDRADGNAAAGRYDWKIIISKIVNIFARNHGNGSGCFIVRRTKYTAGEKENMLHINLFQFFWKALKWKNAWNEKQKFKNSHLNQQKSRYVIFICKNWLTKNHFSYILTICSEFWCCQNSWKKLQIADFGSIKYGRKHTMVSDDYGRFSRWLHIKIWVEKNCLN